jgi:ribosome-binding protein aMBF1 (putative translation factor)
MKRNHTDCGCYRQSERARQQDNPTDRVWSFTPPGATLAAVKDDPDLLALGREARRLREARDLTQEELADRAGLHPNYIGRIERGESNVGVKALFKLARGLGVSPAALLEQ